MEEGAKNISELESAGLSNRCVGGGGGEGGEGGGKYDCEHQDEVSRMPVDFRGRAGLSVCWEEIREKGPV